MSDNLNDIFADVQDSVPNSSADGIKIEIWNRANNASHAYKIYPENTLGKVLEVCRNDLGLTSSGNQVIFEFDGKTSSDPTLTVSEFGIVNGGKLLINPNGKVA